MTERPTLGQASRPMDTEFGPASLYYPTPPLSALTTAFVGKRVHQLAAPAAVIDVAKAKQNCNSMLETAMRLQIGFRAHVKTHKTIELAKIQLGDHLSNARPEMAIKLVASTVAEIEHLMPFLHEAARNARNVDVIYGVPPTQANISRLLALSNILQHAVEMETPAFSILADHIDQLKQLSRLVGPNSTSSLGVFIKIDTGYHRAGVQPGSKALSEMVEFLALVGKEASHLVFRGLYSHMGNSYGGSCPGDAIRSLNAEIEGLEQAGMSHCAVLERAAGCSLYPITLSVGATPTAFAAQNLIIGYDDSPAIRQLRDSVERVQKSLRFGLELHAGVYPLLDMQQVATHARPDAHTSVTEEPPLPGLSVDNIALRILVEVVSLYASRDKPEALVSAGTLALGREPCQSYAGWGIVSPWRYLPEDESPTTEGSARNQRSEVVKDPMKVPFYNAGSERTGWIVGRISQEHGILSWEGPRETMSELKIGDKLLIWPNHACIAEAGFGWYAIVDSESGDPDVIRDIWIRCRGW